MSATYCRVAPGHPVHGPYHDCEYGFPTSGESVLFERLVLEINQAGLSWLTILKKRAAFRAAFAGFEVDRVASFGHPDTERLLADPGIIRNRLKVEAVVENARRIQALRESHGSFAGWLDTHHPRSPLEWTRLFRQTFRFTGGQIVNEFLMSVGYLPGRMSRIVPFSAGSSNTRHPGRECSRAFDGGKGFVRNSVTDKCRQGFWMSLRQKYVKIFSELFPAGAMGVSLLLGSAVPADANQPPAGVLQKSSEISDVSGRLAAIREAVSDLSRNADLAVGDQQLAWGNWWRNGGWRGPGWRNGGWGPGWRNWGWRGPGWRNGGWPNWWRNW